MSLHHALLSLVMLPSSQQGVSSVGQGLCWLCMHRPHEDVMGLEWCMGRPPPPCSLPKLHISSRLCLPTMRFPPCRASFLAVCEFGWARVVLAVHRPHEDVVGLEWCVGMPPPCSLPKLHFSSRLCLPTMRFPPCRASFLAVCEFGWARVVLAVHRPHEDVVGLEWCVGMPPPCSLPKLHFCSRLCLPTMRFSPLSCFLPRSKE